MAVSYKIISKFYGLLDIIYFRNNSNNPRNLILQKIPNENKKILEIAVGTAMNSILIAKNRPKVIIVGIDLSEEMLDIAKNKVKKNRIQNIEFAKMDGGMMTFENEAFDFIIVSLLLHELREDITNNLLKECYKVLKQDGKIFILEWEEPKKIIQKVLFSIIKLLEPREYKIFMKKDLNKYFSKNSFKINEIEYGDYSKVIELIKITNRT
jgi:demethylmenaquinone methyltransferase/2-methoxy-6-polyprenyl-1,4-benzoquinol methylase